MGAVSFGGIVSSPAQKPQTPSSMSLTLVRGQR
jgi:hypothetical protein